MGGGWEAELEEGERRCTYYPPPPAPGKLGQAGSSCLPPLLQGLSDGGMDEGTESHTLEGDVEPAGEKGSVLY